MYAQSHKDLVVWQESMKLAKMIFLITCKFPLEEKYGLSSQMRRCSISIPSNIAEGKKRGTRKDFVQFLRIADGSAAELETQLLLAQDFYPGISCVEALESLSHVQKMLTSMISKMVSRM